MGDIAWIFAKLKDKLFSISFHNSPFIHPCDLFASPVQGYGSEVSCPRTFRGNVRRLDGGPN